MKGTTRVRAEEVGRGERPVVLPIAEATEGLAVQWVAAEAIRSLEAVVMAAHRALRSAQRLEEALTAMELSERGGKGPCESSASPPGHVHRTGPPLASREEEVLALVAAGRSNKEIARALFVSPNTVKSHVASLLTKLRADSRVQLTSIATQHDLHVHAARQRGSERACLSPH